MTRPRSLAASLALLLLSLTACTNYDFSRARTPDGGWNVEKLIADLEASGEPQLRQGTWIPLIHADLQTFGPSDPRMPAGYTLTGATTYGPVFLAGGLDKRIFDEAGQPVERFESNWVGWGLAYYDTFEQIETTHGRRIESKDRLLLAFGGDTTFYADTDR